MACFWAGGAWEGGLPGGSSDLNFLAPFSPFFGAILDFWVSLAVDRALC